MSSPTLLGLPHEVQNRIYRLVLKADLCIWVCTSEDRENERAALKLLETCRLIHAMAKPMYYGMNTLTFDSFEPQWLLPFLTAIGPDTLRLCRGIELFLPGLGVKDFPLCCGQYFRMNFKDGIVSADSCDVCRGRPAGEYREEFLPELEVLMKSIQRRPYTRNWAAVAAKELGAFVSPPCGPWFTYRNRAQEFLARRKVAAYLE